MLLEYQLTVDHIRSDEDIDNYQRFSCTGQPTASYAGPRCDRDVPPDVCITEGGSFKVTGPLYRAKTMIIIIPEAFVRTHATDDQLVNYQLAVKAGMHDCFPNYASPLPAQSYDSYLICVAVFIANKGYSADALVVAADLDSHDIIGIDLRFGGVVQYTAEHDGYWYTAIALAPLHVLV